MNKIKPKKEESPKAEKRKKSGVARSVINVLNGEFLSRETAVQHLPYMFFLTFLLICYIAYGYYAEKTIRELDTVNSELKELKTEEAFTSSQLDTRRQETEVRPKVEALGLRSYQEPPLIIRVSDEPGNEEQQD